MTLVRFDDEFIRDWMRRCEDNNPSEVLDSDALDNVLRELLLLRSVIRKTMAHLDRTDDGVMVDRQDVLAFMRSAGAKDGTENERS